MLYKNNILYIGNALNVPIQVGDYAYFTKTYTKTYSDFGVSRQGVDTTMDIQLDYSKILFFVTEFTYSLTITTQYTSSASYYMSCYCVIPNILYIYTGSPVSILYNNLKGSAALTTPNIFNYTFSSKNMIYTYNSMFGNDSNKVITVPSTPNHTIVFHLRYGQNTTVILNGEMTVKISGISNITFWQIILLQNSSFLLKSTV